MLLKNNAIMDCWCNYLYFVSRLLMIIQKTKIKMRPPQWFVINSETEGYRNMLCDIHSVVYMSVNISWP